jgi:predicted ATPase/DNA-binding winged helix-turn-helix (wHTH) protein
MRTTEIPFSTQQRTDGQRWHFLYRPATENCNSLGNSMRLENAIVFEPFCLDLTNQCLRRGPEIIKLRPKAFAVLNYLVAHPGQLVTKEDLLKAVWPETFVGEAVLKVTIGQLRSALDDDPQCPEFIETAHRRGYRFIGQLTPSDEASESAAEVTSAPARHRSVRPGVVGRNEALFRMRSWLDKVLLGERQVIFVTGEAGIGKTALVDTFARRIGSDRSIRIGRGQCLEQYGTSEAYLPFLEAIARLCREQPKVTEVLRAHAPMWLLQMPSVLNAADREALSREVFGATRERMLREMSGALEALAGDLPLILIFEDLQWSDYSTLDLISYLARQRQPARLMLIGTYRAADLIMSGHPLKAVKTELLARQQCEELPLEYLTEPEVTEYLTVRFPSNEFPPALAGFIHERTEGNPLFMVNAIDYLTAEGLIAAHGDTWKLEVDIEKVELGVPDSIRQMIEKQLEHLDPQLQRTLEAASVAGAEFPTVAVASAIDESRATVEARCDQLARQHQFIEECGVQELPNGDAVTRYGFIHALYQNALYDRLPASRRVQLHRRIGEHGELLYGERAGEIAAELAMHFERGALYRQSVTYLEQAAKNEILRFAYQEAVDLARRGLELLERLPDSPERTRQELRLQLTLGVPLVAIQGYAACDVGAVYTRARELCQRLGDTEEISQVLWGLRTFFTVRAELGTAREIAEEFLRLSERLPYPGLALRGHWALEITFLHLGEFELAMRHFEKALELYDPAQHREDAFRYGQNPGVAMRCFAAWALWFLGKPAAAKEKIDKALTLARELSEPYGLAHAFFFAAILHQLRRDVRLAREYAEAAIAVSSEHGLVLFHALATIVRGWTRIEPGLYDSAIREMRQGLAAYQSTGTEVIRPHFLALLAEAYAKAGRADEGLRVAEEALEAANRNGERYYQAELYRIKGELLLVKAAEKGVSRAVNGRHVLGSMSPALAEAEQSLRQALETARRQNAKSCELRAALSLARLHRDLGVAPNARSLLSQIYDGFADGFDTVDMREAKSLLSDLQQV